MITKKLFCNPINLEYKYQFEQKYGSSTVFREGADPSIVRWHGKYYLFMSMSRGFFTSQDLCSWSYHPLKWDNNYDYAPDVRIIDDYLYFSASRLHENCPIYRTKDPINGPFEKVTELFPFWDPNLFQDDDKHIYFYWGCSNKEPLYGIELNRKNFQPIGEKVALIFGDYLSKGFERRGPNNSLTFPSEREQIMAEILGIEPYIEGAWMTKYNNRYYLQYAAPGTQYNSYGDGVYVGESPLGPFTYQRNNPFSYKPGGFINGAGHGSTFQDAYNNWWHTSTMSISVHHNYERRIGLWKSGFDIDGELFTNTAYGDWPFYIESASVNPWSDPPFMLLSYRKPVTSSSSKQNHIPSNITDENIRTWWTASSNDSSEYAEIDLETEYEVSAIQVNFADDNIKFELPANASLHDRGFYNRYIDEIPRTTRYLLTYSLDGNQYHTAHSTLNAKTNFGHDLITFDTPCKLRYLRISHMSVPFNQEPSISGLRVFGRGTGPNPQSINTCESRLEADVSIHLSWPSQSNTVGYTVWFGYRPDKLYHSYMVYGDNNLTLNALNKGQSLYLRIDSFNENGITKGKIQQVKE